MMAPNTKSARSRFSSPMAFSSSPTNNKGPSEGQRNFMQRWLEPPVQNKASFQEAGLMRAGVVENMAPLGTLPKPAMLKKPSIPGDATPNTSSVKRIVLKKSAPPKESKTMEEMDNSGQASAGESPERESADAGVGSPTRPFFPINGLDDDEDEDYTPNSKSKTRHSTGGGGSNIRQRPVRARRRSSARPKSPVAASIHSPVSHAHPHSHSHSHSQSHPNSHPHSLPHSHPHSPTQVENNNITNTNMAMATKPDPPIPVTFNPPASLQNRQPGDKNVTDKVVEYAVDEALRHYRYPTAWALRLLYDEYQSDPLFRSMIEDIFSQKADSETIKEFTRLVEDKKRDGKHDNKGCYYFVPQDTVDRSQKPKPAPFGNLLSMEFAKALRQDIDGHVSKKLKLDNEAHKAPSHGAIKNGSSGGSGSGSGGVKGITLKSSESSKPTKSPKASRRKRSGSVSSDSSTLSSLPDDVPDDYDEFMDDLSVVSRLGSAAPNTAPTPVDSTQPISDQEKKPASKKKNVSPKPSPNTILPSHPRPHDSSDMPAAVLTNGLSHNRNRHNIKFQSRFADLASPDDDALFQAKQGKKAETKSVTESKSAQSFTRDPLAAETSEEEVVPALALALALAPAPAPAPAEPTRSTRTPALSRRAARAAKRNHEDVENSVSPSAASFKDLEPPSTRNSRAATPSNANLRSTAKKQKTGLRVKTSPMKKKGSAAGIPRGSGERPSPVGNGATSYDKDDNDDSCYTCGGSGELVCCDGCTNSFHFLCIDPPMDDGHMPDEWFCYECQSNYFPATFSGHKGAFGSLLDNIDKKNSRAFRLPKDIRDFFEGVKTGSDGEYEEIVSSKPKTNRRGYDEPFDFFKVRDAHGKAVLCHCCHQGTTENRPVIPCSICGLNWHLECLEPPLTIPPVVRNWRCPCHVEDALMDRLAPAHKYRRIRNAPIIEQAYSRGLANNGHIEIEEDDDEPEDYVKHRDFGRVYRISEKGIKLDFITRVHHKRQQAQKAPATKANPALPIRTVDEQQVALSLSQLSISGNGVGQLVNALISEASPAALALMAQGDASRIARGDLSAIDTKAIEAMLAQIDALRSGVVHILENRSSNMQSSTTGQKQTCAPSLSKDNAVTEGSAMQMD